MSEQISSKLNGVVGRLRMQLAIRCLAPALLLSGAVAFVLALLRVLTAESISGWFAIGALTVGIALAIAWALTRKVELLTAAKLVDARYKLHDRISTAIALDAQGKNSPAVTLQANDAAQHLGRVQAGEVVKMDIPRALWSGIVVSLIAIGMALWPLPKMDEVEAAPDVQVVDQRKPDATLPEVLGSTANRSLEVVDSANVQLKVENASEQPNPSENAAKIYFQN